MGYGDGTTAGCHRFFVDIQCLCYFKIKVFRCHNYSTYETIFKIKPNSMHRVFDSVPRVGWYDLSVSKDQRRGRNLI